MRKVYNQFNLSLIVDGVQIMDFAEGATFVYTFDGGEVQFPICRLLARAVRASCLFWDHYSICPP